MGIAFCRSLCYNHLGNLRQADRRMLQGERHGQVLSDYHTGYPVGRLKKLRPNNQIPIQRLGTFENYFGLRADLGRKTGASSGSIHAIY